jgi:hypothetical protein
MTSPLPDKPPTILTQKLALLAMLFASPVFLLCIFLHRVDEGIGLWICAGIVVGFVLVRWDLRKYAWFWLAISIAVLLQIPFAIFVPWTDRYMSSVSLLPFGFLDYALVYGCVKLAEKLAARQVSSDRS